MEKTKLQQLQNLLEELRQERLKTIAKDLQYKTVDALLKDYDELELEEYDDGDNLLQGIDIVSGVVEDELKK